MNPSGYTDHITKLQERILKHIIKCDVQSETASHIAESLGLSGPTVFKSMKLLLKKEYLRSEQPHKRGKRTLTLTQKGDAMAVMLGSSFEEWSKYIHRRRPVDEGVVRYLEGILSSMGARDFYLRLWVRFGLDNNCFEKGGNWKALSEKEMRRFLRSSVAQIMAKSTQSSEAGKFDTRKNFIEETGFNKSLLRQYLHQHRLVIDSMINDLDE